MSNNPKCIFRTRLIETMRKKKISIVKLADKLNYSVDTIKKYRRDDNGNIPQLDIVKRIANALDVDTAYLLGEQEFEHIKAQKTHELTGLSPSASEKLESMDKDDIQMLSLLLENERFLECMSNCWGFIHSHYSNSITINNPLSKDFRCHENQNSKILKYSASDSFSLILEDIFKSREEQAKIDYEQEVILDIINLVQVYIHTKKDKEMTIMVYNSKQNTLKSLNPHSPYAEIDFNTMVQMQTDNPTDIYSAIPNTHISVTSNVPNGILKK